MFAFNVLGLQVPQAGAVFLVTLAFHVVAGITCVVAGTLAATARKRPGRHPRSGHVYLWGIAAVFVTATVMAFVRWREDWHLFLIATVTAALALLGWQARVQRTGNWVRWHAIGMGGSFIALLTGFYVDNGPQLPLWRLLPHWMYWVLPSAVGIPVIWSALRRFRAGVSTRPRAAGIVAGRQ